MEEQLPILLFRNKSAKRLQNLCKCYWAFSRTEERMTAFSHSLDVLAEQHGCDAQALEIKVKGACEASMPCRLCQKPISVTDRRELVLLRAAGEEAANCDTCTSLLRKHHSQLFELEQQERFTRPIINGNHPKQQYFDKLRSYFPRVYPNLAPSVFIHKSSPVYPAPQDAWFDYFLKTRVTFTICNIRNVPVAVIDWPEGQGENTKETMMNYKRRLMQKSGIKYYVFPQDEQAFVEAAESIRMYCWLSVLPYGLEDILRATVRRELLSSQQP